MEWQTHMLSGVVAGYMITDGDWKGAVVGGIAGIVPDFDEPESKFGKLFFFISIPVSSFFEHRTFTHSMLFTLLASVIVYPFIGLELALAFMAGLFAHIGGDMLTGKVKLLYPSKRSVGIPIPRSMFLVIDRLFRYVLLVFFVVMLARDINIISSNDTVAIIKKLF